MGAKLEQWFRQTFLFLRRSPKHMKKIGKVHRVRRKLSPLKDCVRNGKNHRVSAALRGGEVLARVRGHKAVVNLCFGSTDWAVVCFF